MVQIFTDLDKPRKQIEQREKDRFIQGGKDLAVIAAIDTGVGLAAPWVMETLNIAGDTAIEGFEGWLQAEQEQGIAVFDDVEAYDPYRPANPFDAAYDDIPVNNIGSPDVIGLDTFELQTEVFEPQPMTIESDYGTFQTPPRQRGNPFGRPNTRSSVSRTRSGKTFKPFG